MTNPVITPELLCRYDRPGPRYTSYPTVPVWRADFRDEHYRHALKSASQYPERPLSLYVHIPFCIRRCAYCGCNTITEATPETIGQYLDAVHEEIRLAAEALGMRKSVAQLHWGGGTPTCLTTTQMQRLHKSITDVFSLCDDAEVAIETNPHSLRDEQLVCLSALGFNRISFGVQDLDEAVQQVCERGQSALETQQVIARARELGFQGINVDLIYGLPLQEKKAWKRTLEQIIVMNPDRIAIYSYAHLPQRFPHQRAFDGMPIPDTEDKYALFAQARQQLVEAGYVAIGMDHFSLPGDELARALDKGTLNRNFMGYTVQAAPDQIGFGLSAISDVANCYSQNAKTLEHYLSCISDGVFAVERGMQLSRDDCIRRWVIQRLMCVFDLDTALLNDIYEVDFDDYFAQELNELRAYQAAGMIQQCGPHWQVTALGAVFIRNICMVFDAYLDESQRTLFSRTI